MDTGKKRGLLVVLSGPSGTGKGTICQRLQEEVAIGYSISATTRQPRTGEENGKAYFFLSKEAFLALIEEDGLLEWASVYDNYYGTPKSYVENLLASGQDCILEIDTQGAFKVRESMPEAVLIFIAPPSLEELEKRIVGRATESAAEVEKRMSCARDEIRAIKDYDYVVVNDEVDLAVEKMKAILMAEQCKVGRNLILV